MINEINFYPEQWKKDIYIANKLGVDYDEETNEIVTYSEPREYSFSVNTVNTNAELAEFGEKASITKKMVVPIKYKDEFKEFDVVYLDTTPDEEENFGDNADYMMLPPRVGNAVMIIYIQKILGK